MTSDNISIAYVMPTFFNCFKKRRKLRRFVQQDIYYFNVVDLRYHRGHM